MRPRASWAAWPSWPDRKGKCEGGEAVLPPRRRQPAGFGSTEKKNHRAGAARCINSAWRNRGRLDFDSDPRARVNSRRPACRPAAASAVRRDAANRRGCGCSSAAQGGAASASLRRRPRFTVRVGRGAPDSPGSRFTVRVGRGAPAVGGSRAAGSRRAKRRLRASLRARSSRNDAGSWL